MTSHHTRGSMTTLHEFGGVIGRRPLNTFVLGSHNFMVTALGSCVKWPLLVCTPKKTVLAASSPRSINTKYYYAAHLLET